MSPPFTRFQVGVMPAMATLLSSMPSKLTGPLLYSPMLTLLTVGSERINSASSTVSQGIRRQGDSASEPSDTSSPPEKYRWTKNVLGPADSRMLVMLWLMPVIADAMAITTVTPMATPRMVSAARTLLA